jgi:RimJ/RimL family protein N-acetyltransferase
LHYDAQNPGFGFWIVDEKASGNFLGWLSFRPTGSESGEVALGFRLRKSAWGKGFAAEGSRVLIRKGFREWGVKKVVATTYEKNWSSQRVMEKLGMKMVRKFRYTEDDLKNADTFHVDSAEIWDGYDLEFALDKAEWEKQQKG